MIAATTNSFKITSPYFRAEDESNGYVGELTTPVGWGKNADSAGGITPKLQVREVILFSIQLKGDSSYLLIYWPLRPIY